VRAKMTNERIPVPPASAKRAVNVDTGDLRIQINDKWLYINVTEFEKHITRSISQTYAKY